MSAEDAVCFGCGAAVPAAAASGACPGCGELLVTGASARRTGLAAADLAEPSPSSPVPPEVTQARSNPQNLFDQYVILDELGQGGAASVHRAWDAEQRRYVALKILKTAYKEQTARALREAHAVTQLSHPNIVKIHKAGVHEGWRFIAMELIPGRTLDEALAEPRLRGDLRASLAIFRTICDAIAHAHARGIVHRDLKPQNILVDADGHPYVVDFGIARPTEPGWTVTMANEAIGTPAFMAPEQVLGGTPATLSPVDVYALGAILYYMLTGRPPFDGATPYETMERVTRDVLVPPRAIVPSLPRDLETVCLKALEKDPAQRYGSVKELADEVGRWLSGDPVQALPISGATRLWRRLMRHRIATASVAISTVLVAGVALVAAWRVLHASGQREEEAERSRRQQKAFLLLEDARASLAKAARYQYHATATYAELLRQIDEARPSADQALQLLPGFPPARQLLGEAWELAGRYDEAETEWSAALAADPAYAPAGYRLGRLKLIRAFLATIWGSRPEKEARRAEGERLAKEGKALLEASMRHRRSMDDPLQRGLAEALLAFTVRDFDAVLSISKAGVERFRGMNGVEEFHWLAGLASDQGTHLGNYDAALALRPKHPIIRFCRGIERYKAGDRDGARADYEVTVEFAPRFAPGFLNRGLCREHGGDPAGAMEDFSRAIELDPRMSSPYVDRGILKRVNGDLPGALADLDAALAINPADANAWRNRANIHRDAGRKEEADADYTRAVGLDPGLAAAWHGRGTVRQDLGDLEAAISDYARAIDLDPADAKVWNSRGTAWLARKDRAKALADFTQAILLDPDYAKARYNRGNLRQTEGDFRGAVSDYDRAVDLDPKYAKAWAQRGYARRSLGDISGAVADFRQALGTAPPDWPDRARIEEAVRETERQQVH